MTLRGPVTDCQNNPWSPSSSFPSFIKTTVSIYYLQILERHAGNKSLHIGGSTKENIANTPWNIWTSSATKPPLFKGSLSICALNYFHLGQPEGPLHLCSCLSRLPIPTWHLPTGSLQLLNTKWWPPTSAKVVFHKLWRAQESTGDRSKVQIPA